MNSDALVGFLLGVVAAAALAGVTDDDVGYTGGAMLGLVALGCIASAFVLVFWDFLRWVI